jgi:hypothetical protein
MSRDVDQSAARERALRTLDERRAAANATQPLPPSPQRPVPAYGAPPYAPSPVYVPPAQPSNGLMSGLIGFMLGRAMSQGNQPVAYPTTSSPQAAPVPTAAAVPASPPEPSFMARVLRVFAWLSVISLLVWAAIYSVRKFRRLRAAPNYAFERN